MNLARGKIKNAILEIGNKSDFRRFLIPDLDFRFLISDFPLQPGSFSADFYDREIQNLSPPSGLTNLMRDICWHI